MRCCCWVHCGQDCTPWLGCSGDILLREMLLSLAWPSRAMAELSQCKSHSIYTRIMRAFNAVCSPCGSKIRNKGLNYWIIIYLLDCIFCLSSWSCEPLEGRGNAQFMYNSFFHPLVHCLLYDGFQIYDYWINIMYWRVFFWTVKSTLIKGYFKRWQSSAWHIVDAIILPESFHFRQVIYKLLYED